jgi:hypothetical protein
MKIHENQKNKTHRTEFKNRQSLSSVGFGFTTVILFGFFGGETSCEKIYIQFILCMYESFLKKLPLWIQFWLNWAKRKGRGTRQSKVGTNTRFA